MHQPFFSGVCTALVTPFLNGKINYPMLDVLIRRQRDAGIAAVVLAGTTGESPTLTDSEKIELFQRGKAAAGDTMLVIAGTGSNSTEHAVALSKAAQEAGVDALLVVSPYYNKANSEGLIAHYLAIAHAVKIPIIVYNVPSRTGVDIPVSVYRTLSRIPNIVGVKEASTSMEKVLDIFVQCGQDFTVWSGNDDLTVPILSLGGKGVISVASNVLPEQVNFMTQAALDGDFDTAAALQCKLYPLTKFLFSDINPIPVKAAMAYIGLDCGDCRLPLTGMGKSRCEELRKIL